MIKAILASAVVIAASSAAWAVDTPLPNGSFEANQANGFSQTITNWTVNFSGSVPAQFAGPPAQYSGLFTSFGAKLTAGTVPQGTAFAILDNLGAGTVTLTSGASGVNFQLVDRNISFRYAYLTNDPAGSGARDTFTVHVDFFNSASSTTPIGSLDKVIATQGQFNDSGVGFSPFGGAANNANATFNDAGGTNAGVFNLVNLDVSQFFGSFARISFIVDNNGPAAGTNGNGLGVSGIALDNVLMNPEPSTMALFALGMAGLGGFAWRRRGFAKKPA